MQGGEEPVVVRGVVGRGLESERAGGEGGGAREQGLPLLRRRGRERLLEELARDAEREPALELAAAREEDSGSRPLGLAADLLQQPGLAAAGGALQYQKPAGSSDGAADETADVGQLRVALQELVRHGATLSGRLHQSSGLAPDDLAGRARDTRAVALRSLILEIESEIDPVSGWLSDERGERRRFSGWLGLAAALETVIDDAPACPSDEAEDHP